ncbi:MAG TPA: hypothetical protein VF406_21260 [Thermodesulfobacteriota bacterium]
MSRAYYYDDVADDLVELDDEGGLQLDDDPWEDEEPMLLDDPDLESDAYREADALERLEAGLPACRRCGCTSANACPGGCVWATPDLCSRCVA